MASRFTLISSFLVLSFCLALSPALAYDLPQVCIDAHKLQKNSANSDLHKVIRLYDQCLRGNLSPANKGVTYLNRGVAKKKLRDYDGAMADYDEAIRLVPDDPTKHYNRALLYHDMGDFGKAIEGYTKAIELNPGYAKAYGNRAFSLKECGDIYRAKDDARKARQLDPKVKVPSF